LSLVLPGVFLRQKNIFKIIFRKFGSFDFLTVIEAKGESITRFAEAKEVSK